MVTLQITKNGRPRYIPLNDLLCQPFAMQRGSQRDSRGCSSTVYGDLHVGPRTWFEKAVTSVELSDVTWHTLRYTSASRLAVAGIDLRTLQELLGHMTGTMTLRYTHLTPGHNLAAVERLCDTKNSTDPQLTQAQKRSILRVLAERSNLLQQLTLDQYRPDGEIGRHSGLKIVYVTI
jgi:integrase